MDRRLFLRAAATGLAAAATPLAAAATPPAAAATPPAPAAGRLRQSVCRWCHGGMPLPALCELAKSQGIMGIDLLSEDEWDVPARHGLTCTCANGPSSIPRGFNRLEHHPRLVAESERLLPLVAAAGIPTMIVFSGNRDGMGDAEGLRNCAEGLRRITPLAESLGVTVVMELLNSRVDHPDYMCDRTEWGAALVEQVASDRFRLLYDVYHMQIMEGDLIRTIRRHADAIGHYHTAGNPGRSNLDATQELCYPAIAAAIADTGFGGWVAHEFMPRGDRAASLRQAVEACRA
jgi:hydroxypyruvate isomerase